MNIETPGDIEFVSSVAPEMAASIRGELRGIEARENARILFAVESGSRAWGFPSPDSDYDVRFVYVRPVDWYLSIAPGRDVVEMSIDGLLDIGGWDIQKALGLLIKPNPVLLEWLSSPIRYVWDDTVCRRLIDFSRKVTHGPACLHHYLHLGGRQWRTHVEGKTQVNLKKYFYVARPTMALRWMRRHPDVPPPMNFHALLSGVGLPSDIARELDALLIRKSRTKEMGDDARIPAIDGFIQAELDWAREAVRDLRADSKYLKAEADALFRSIVKSA